MLGDDETITNPVTERLVRPTRHGAGGPLPKAMRYTEPASGCARKCATTRVRPPTTATAARKISSSCWRGSAGTGQDSPRARSLFKSPDVFESDRNAYEAIVMPASARCSAVNRPWVVVPDA